MKILFALTYYLPHMSGLTIYAERLAKALIKEGHYVTIMTSQYDSQFPIEEVIDGVRVVRVPVWMRISKGVLMPAFGHIAGKLLREHDVVHLHLPQFDSARVVLRGWLQRKPIVITYHCDLKLPRTIFNWFANQSVLIMNNIAAVFTDRIVTYTRDYAEHSRFIMRFKKKLSVINPPVQLPRVTQEQIKEFGKKQNPDNAYPIIGMAARFASEKGVEVLLNSLDSITKKYPNAQVWFAGPYENIMGEQQYYDRLKPLIDRYISKGNWKFLGLLSPTQMALFYPNIDVLTIPSLNSTEAFGLIQIEAMINGVPSIASNLPGVRQPVLRHQMGEIIPIGDSKMLADAVNKIMGNYASYSDHYQGIAAQYAPKKTAQAYEKLYGELLGRS